MAGTNEPDCQQPPPPPQGTETESSFQWDEQSQLYYHASSGFYHDPAAGWYYSSRDGLYYKFENGNYVPWQSHQDDQADANQCELVLGDKDVDCITFAEGESKAYAADAIHNESGTVTFAVDSECISNHLSENPPPPSEWLEDTLIELYLSGYSNQATDAASEARMLDDGSSINIEGLENDNADELEEGEWIPEGTHETVDGNGVASGEDASWEEEIWRSQYGQVVQSDKEPVPDFPVVDLWDWAMVKGAKKGGKGSVCRLVGRLVRQTTKLHPSMPSSSGLLKTSPICEVHLDLVRVRSGQVYKLRSPKLGYIASLPSYDSSNPTKDWGFPELSMENQSKRQPKSSLQVETQRGEVRVDNVESAQELSAIEKNKGHVYRDRAAERRTLHGGFGIGPGQKKLKTGVDSAPSSPISASPEEAAIESLNKSFGVGSYARRILESMGWKEGESLGNSVKGLTEPLQAVGNKGSSGLGWDQKRNWKHD